jgi:hypothetical protein
MFLRIHTQASKKTDDEHIQYVLQGKHTAQIYDSNQVGMKINRGEPSEKKTHTVAAE